ncbi:MAG TPA: penicillin-binding protein 2 [Gemmatimonadales bacterium]
MSFHPNDLARRSRAAAILLLVVFVWLGSAFFRAQVLRNEDYSLQSRQNRLREVPLPAPRGVILDRNGQIIAESVPGYTVLLTLERTARTQAVEDTIRATLRRLGEFIPYTERDVETAVRRYRRDPARPVVVLADARFDVVSVLEERIADFPGLIIQSAPKRYYPDGPAVAHLVGYTGEISERELQAREDEGYKPGQQIGKAGLEQQYEKLLRGREGTSFIEVNAFNRVVRREGVRPELRPQPADTLQTNIDLSLQRFVYGLFEGDTSLAGGIIAMDPQTGGVLALHSNPSYDPNLFIGGIGVDEYAVLRDDPRKPLHNKVIQGKYPPASTFKLIIAAIGMERGLVGMNSRMPQPCSGGIWYGSRYFRCWNRSGHGSVNLQQAIAKSCNVYFYQLGQQIGLENLLREGVEIGMGRRTGIDLPNEHAPTWPSDVEYFDELYGPRGWTRSVTLNLSIGQGENTQTVINMARAYAALATDGSAPEPTIADSASERRPAFSLSAAQLDSLRGAMMDVVSARGTAGASALQGIAIAGKTGTAQTGRAGERDHAWFVGFAPAEAPRIVVAVFVVNGEHGSSAARLASRTIEHYLKRPARPVQVTEE